MTERAAVAAALLVWALLIAVCDWRHRRIPNALLLVVLLPAGALCVWRGSGLLGIPMAASAIGFVAGFAVTLPGYLLRLLGAGDVKLAATLGLLLGLPALWPALLIAALVLGAMALFARLRHSGDTGASRRLPAAVPLAAGFAAMLMRSQFPEAP